jgi:DoxX-like family
MNLVLWIVAGLLALVFLVSGSVKLFVLKENLDGLLQRLGPAAQATGEWTRDFSPGALKAIGVLELLGAMGLILPAALDIAAVLVPVAASGAVLLFVGAVTMRLRRGERATIVLDLVYLGMAAFVASGRFGPWSFTG